MKIGHKIALFYTTTTILILMVIVSVIYIFTTRYIDKLYYSYLVEKATITAQKHWEKDEVDEKSYSLIQKRYAELLPQAQERLFNADSSSYVQDSLSKYLSPLQIRNLKNEHPVLFKYKKQFGVALYYPDNEGNFIVIVMARNDYGTEIREHIGILILILACLSSLFIYLIGRLYANRILKPLKQVLKELKRIRGNNLNVRLKTVNNKDELDKLVGTLNEMLDRIDSAFQSEKSFISHASHELNNPITAIQGECEISLMKERSVPEYIEALKRIETESKRLSQLTKSLLFLSRRDKEMLQQLREGIDLYGFLSQLCKGNERIVINYAGSDVHSFVEANPYLLRIALENIIENACKYSGDNAVTITLTDKSGFANVCIEDEGIGIPESEIQHIFQSFYRASNTREYSGHGIGLSLSYRILSFYGATVKVESELEKYTRVIVTLPLISRGR